MTCSVIIAAYNNFAALRLALWGYEAQTRQDFDIIIADDGSTGDFLERLAAYQRTSPLRIRHIWQPDEGFRKCAILNRAVCAATAEYLIFTDADVVPRRDFVATHLALARPGRFHAGSAGHVEIPESLYQRLAREDVASQRIFRHDWFRQHQLGSFRYRLRLGFQGIGARFADAVTPRRDAFIGANAGVFRDDVLAVKGFDETLGYGAEDRDLGVRLANHGVRGFQHKYSLCCVHLEHDRPYRIPAVVARQVRLYRQRRADGIIYPLRGIGDEIVMPSAAAASR